MGNVRAQLTPLVHVPANQQQLQRIQELSASYKKLMEEFITAFNSNQEFDEKRRELANSVLDGCAAVAKAGMSQTQNLSKGNVSALNFSVWVMVIGLLVALALGVIIAWVITKAS